MNCHELQTVLLETLDGPLPPEQQESLLTHLEQCETCRREYAEWQRQEEQLEIYYARQREHLLHSSAASPEHLRDALARKVGPARAPRRALWPRLGWLAAAAALLIVVGGAAWLYWSRVPLGSRALATVAATEGLVQRRVEGRLKPVTVGDAILQGEDLKVSGGGYLALGLDGANLLEVRENTQLRLADLPGAFEVQLDLGSVWAHLPTRPAKPFVVRTAQLRATARGTVFAVDESLDESRVIVAEGTVEVNDGAETVAVEAGQTCTSGELNVTDAAGWAAESVAWSRQDDELAWLLPEEMAAVEPLLITEPAEPAATPVAAESSAEPAAITDLLDLLPADTGCFLDIRDVAAQLGRFAQTDYQALFQRPEFAQWWQNLQGIEEIREGMEELHLASLMKMAGMLNGQFVIGGTPGGEVILVCEHHGHEAEFESLLVELTRGDGGVLQPLDPRLRLLQGRLIISSSVELAATTADRLLRGEPTGFRDGAFYTKVQANVGTPPFVLAFDVAGLTDRVPRDDSNRRVLDFTGLTGADVAILSPSFADRGMNQAARLTFQRERFGVLNWLREPGPMRGLRFFTSDIHFFSAALLRPPRAMLYDFILFNFPDPESAAHRRLMSFAEENQAFLDAFGAELLVGVDSPILPIPNLKVIAEIDDQASFEAGLAPLLDKLIAALEEQGKFAYVETSDYKGRTIHTFYVDGWLVQPAWAVVDDYVVAGPGPQFVGSAIDVYDSGRSIAGDSRLLSLLPAGGGNVSWLVYQDVARVIPQLIQTSVLARLTETEQAYVPNLSFMERFRAPGIAYVYAHPTRLDLYMNAPGGIDFNLGVAAPLVANWIVPHLNVSEMITRVIEAEAALEELEVAIDRYIVDHQRVPASIDALLGEEGYLDRVPLDPFAADGAPVQMRPGQAPGSLLLWSVGPDGIDQQGEQVFDPEQAAEGPGDIVLRLPR